jgi:hypothetical protein
MIACPVSGLPGLRLISLCLLRWEGTSLVIFPPGKRNWKKEKELEKGIRQAAAEASPKTTVIEYLIPFLWSQAMTGLVAKRSIKPGKSCCHQQ